MIIITREEPKNICKKSRAAPITLEKGKREQELEGETKGVFNNSSWDEKEEGHHVTQGGTH